MGVDDDCVYGREYGDDEDIGVTMMALLIRAVTMMASQLVFLMVLP